MSAASTGADPGAQGGGDTPFKVFKTEQEFQELINATEAKARQIAERRIKTVTADERATMEAMQAELEQRKQRDLEAAGNYEKAKSQLEAAAKARIEAAEAKLQKAQSVARQHLVTQQLRALALTHGAYDPEDVIARLEARIVVDEDYQIHVSDAPGGTVQDGLTMEQAVIDLLKSKPHLAKAPGAGSSAGASGGASLSGSFSGTPSQREAQAAVEKAKAAVAANPRDNIAAANLLRAQQQLTAAQAK